MPAVMYSILAMAMLAAGVLTQLVPPRPFNDTPPVGSAEYDALRLHNYYRGQVGVPALTWCNNLTEMAQLVADWEAGANIPATPKNFTKRSSKNESYSMQIIYLSPANPRLLEELYQATLAFWTDHVYYHDEIIPNGDFFSYSAYTQMVWNGTTRLGMAGATNLDGGTFVVAAYSPPGNIYGQRPFNNRTASMSSKVRI